MNAIFVLEQLLNGLGYGLMLFMLAAGLTLVLGIMDFLNLAHGSLFMIGGYVAASIQARSGSFLLAVAAAAAAVIALALLLETTMVRRFYTRGHLPQMVATFGFALIADDAVKMIWGSTPILSAMPPALAGSWLIVPGLVDGESETFGAEDRVEAGEALVRG